MGVLHRSLRRLAPPLGACLTLAALAIPAGALADDREGHTMEKVEYKGWKNNLRLANDAVELIVTLDVGPRVISYRLKDGKNVFKEYPDQFGKSGESEWMIRGGHRLWVSPEDPNRTYFPDNGPVAHEDLPGGGVRLKPAVEAPHRLQKSIDVALEGGSRVKVVHRVANVGTQPTDLAVWSLSVMAPGGVEILPLPPARPHPGSTKDATAADFGPSVGLSLWPYTDLKDDRWDLGTRFILLRQDAKKSATKLGLTERAGWVGYVNDGTLFVKRFGYEEGRPYPDGGVNYETFTNEDMLEMESLGPMVRLAPGASVEHTELWELFSGVGEVKSEADAEKNVLPKVQAR